MKILSAAQIREWDLYTIDKEQISSWSLMERAAMQCTQWLIAHNVVDKTVKIFCGKGNNGGDGLAIACQLAEHDIIADVYILEFGALGTPDFQQNLARLHAFPNNIHFIQDHNFFPVIDSTNVIIDALYGSGVNRPLEELSAELIEHINKANAQVISIDLPSGMFIDKHSKTYPAIEADHTLTFQLLKLCFLMPENESYFGDVHVLDIGLNQGYLSSVSSPFYLIDAPLIKQIYKPRKKFAHKGNYGHTLIIAGSEGKMGAAILASKACLRSGAGLLTTCIDELQFSILHTTLPEAMVMDRSGIIDWKKYNSIGIGPGLGILENAIELLDEVLTHYDKPIVLDADALNILAVNNHLLPRIPGNSILTPHPKEFERLFGKSDNDFERLHIALRQSASLQVYIILKGHHTITVCPDGNIYFNNTGNPGMATAGSGDVLTGIITGLISQGYTSRDAAILGVYIHGLAGDYAAKHFSQEALIAGDIIKCLGEAFKAIAIK